MNEFILFCTFFYIGLITIGGGLVGIPTMQQLLVKEGLITSEQFYAMVAISESTPGPIGINMATFIGYEFYGIMGAILTTTASVLPSLIIIIIIAKYFAQISEKSIVKNIFYGLKPAVSGMILASTWGVCALTLITIPTTKTFTLDVFFNPPQIFFYTTLLILAYRIKLNPTFIILAGAVFGIAFL
ncbi:MAG: chromate transporter [Treponemataceae bacterium]